MMFNLDFILPFRSLVKSCLFLAMKPKSPYLFFVQFPVKYVSFRWIRYDFKNADKKNF